jgi:hypothetical protein
MQEARPEEDELRSEAQFQRLLASTYDQPNSPYFSPKAPSDRGRYPEEADTVDAQRESTPSDGDADDHPYPFGSYDSIVVSKTSTPAASVNGDEMPMSVMESPGLPHMEIDMVGSPWS